MWDIMLTHQKKSICIMLCDQGKILDQLDYGEVYYLSEEIKKLLSKYVISNSPIGLLLSHNIFLPPLIISCLSVKSPFVFVNEEDLHMKDRISSLGLEWIITLNNNSVDDFSLHSSLKLRGDDELCLLKKEFVEPCPHNYENIFCIMMSSGTTGKNKIIQIENFCIGNNVECLRQKFGINSQDTIYLGTQLTFDPSLVEILLALTSGACLLITLPKTRLNPTALYRTLFPPSISEYKGITFMQIVPSVFKRWTVDQQKSVLLSDRLRILAFGGEVFPKEILDYDFARELRIFNLYGITEVSCWASIYEIDEKSTVEVSIGEELSETTIEIRNDNGQKVLNGEGEIYIGSSTRRCKVDNEILNRSLPLFRPTGDLGKITPNGILYSGRTNNIIKRFGFRVNLTEIEDTILRETNLVNKCIWCREKSKLITFILLDEGDRQMQYKILHKLRVKLLHTLRKEHFPDSLHIVPKFPLTSHGKINSKALEKYYLEALTENVSFQSERDLFTSLCCKYLGLTYDQFESYKNSTFFELGGNSITAMQLLGEFREHKISEGLDVRLFDSTLEFCSSMLKNDPTSLSKKERILPRHLEEDCWKCDLKKKKYNKNISVKWKYNTIGCVDSPPIVFHYRNHTYVAVGSMSGVFAILDASSGSEVYKYILDCIESSCLPSKRYSRVYIGCYNGRLYCFDYIMNKKEWTFKTGDMIKCQPCFNEEDESTIIFGSYDHHVYCLNAENGSLLWKTETPGCVTSNLYNKATGIIYILTTSGTCLSLHKDSGKIEWQFHSDKPIFCNVTKILDSGDIIYAEVLGRIVCLTKSGKLRWTFQAGGNVCSLLHVINGEILFGCMDGYLYFLKEEGESCKLLYKMCLDSPIVRTPFVCNMWDRDIGVVAVRNGTIFVVDIATKEVLGKYKLNSEVFSSPFVHESMIYVGCRDDFLYCLEIE